MRHCDAAAFDWLPCSLPLRRGRLWRRPFRRHRHHRARQSRLFPEQDVAKLVRIRDAVEDNGSQGTGTRPPAVGNQGVERLFTAEVRKQGEKANSRVERPSRQAANRESHREDHKAIARPKKSLPWFLETAT